MQNCKKIEGVTLLFFFFFKIAELKENKTYIRYSQGPYHLGLFNQPCEHTSPAPFSLLLSTWYLLRGKRGLYNSII